MMQKSSLSVALGLIIASITGCGSYGKQNPPAPPQGMQSITISPASAQLELGANQQFTATATLPEGSTQDVTQSVSWSSSDQTVLRVNTASGRVGLANTRGPGTATIRATANVISGSTSVTVIRRVPKFLYAAGDRGINGYSINPTTGVLAPLASAFTASGTIVSLAVTRDRQFLYAADLDNGKVWGVKIDSSGPLIQVPNSPFAVAGSAPVSVLASPTADFLFVTDFLTGLITTFTIGPDGTLTAQSPRFLVGDHPLAAALTPDGRFTYQTASRPGQISELSIGANGTVSSTQGGTVLTGTRPQHVTIDPSGRFLFAAIPSGSQVDPAPAALAFAIDSATGVLTPVTGSPFIAGENPVFAAVDPSGHFLYVANVVTDATHNAIFGFSIDSDTGALTNIPGATFPDPAFPLSVAVDPGAQFVYVGLSNNQGVQAFSIDQRTGALTGITGSPFPAPASIFAFATTY